MLILMVLSKRRNGKAAWMVIYGVLRSRNKNMRTTKLSHYFKKNYKEKIFEIYFYDVVLVVLIVKTFLGSSIEERYRGSFHPLKNEFCIA